MQYYHSPRGANLLIRPFFTKNRCKSLVVRQCVQKCLFGAPLCPLWAPMASKWSPNGLKMGPFYLQNHPWEQTRTKTVKYQIRTVFTIL